MKGFIEVHMNDRDNKRRLVNTSNISYVKERLYGGADIEMNSGMTIEAKESYEEITDKIKEAQDA